MLEVWANEGNKVLRLTEESGGVAFEIADIVEGPMARVTIESFRRQRIADFVRAAPVEQPCGSCGELAAPLLELDRSQYLAPALICWKCARKEILEARAAPVEDRQEPPRDFTGSQSFRFEADAAPVDRLREALTALLEEYPPERVYAPDGGTKLGAVMLRLHVALYPNWQPEEPAQTERPI